MNPDKIIEEWRDKNPIIPLQGGYLKIRGSEIIQFDFHHDNFLLYKIVIYPSNEGIYFHYYHWPESKPYLKDTRFTVGINTLTVESFSDLMKEKNPNFFEWIIWNLL